MFTKFVELIFQNDVTGKDFYTPMTRSSVKTMSDSSVARKQNIETSQQMSGETMFQRLLAVNAYKNVPADRVFSLKIR